MYDTAGELNFNRNIRCLRATPQGAPGSAPMFNRRRPRANEQAQTVGTEQRSQVLLEGVDYSATAQRLEDVIKRELSLRQRVAGFLSPFCRSANHLLNGPLTGR
jgi:hypothetical protein